MRKKLLDLRYGKTMKKIKEKYLQDKYRFKLDDFSEKELKCIVAYGGLPPTQYNHYEPLRDLDFLLEMKRERSPSNAQLSKKRALTFVVKKFLEKQTEDASNTTNKKGH